MSSKKKQDNNVRKGLQKINGVRATFQGEFIKIGSKSGYKYPQPTLLLCNIKNMDGQIISDHLWFNYTKRFDDLGELRQGDVLRFDARVKKYERGYNGRREDVYVPSTWDYKLSHPTHIVKLENSQGDKA